jgi:hypothetical protein
MVDFLDDVLGRMQGADDDHGAADGERQQDAHGEHEAVKHGQQDREAIVVHGAEHDAAALDVVEEIAMGEHRALGPARGAAGVDDDGKVVARDRGGGRRRGRG